MDRSLILAKIERIEEELQEVKRMVAEDGGENVNLEGIWEGVDISDEEIEEAKRSLSSGIDSYVSCEARAG